MKLLFIVGSLRKQSFNNQLAELARKDIPSDDEVSFLDWRALPIFDQDLEQENPEAIQTIRRQVSQADRIWFFTPEYNGQIPGGLKNLLDWLSRPVNPADRKSGTAIRGKIVAISGVAGKSAATGSRELLEKLLSFLGCKITSNDGYAVPIKEMIADSWSPSQHDLERLAGQAKTLIEFN